jgi:hypothetical protein
MKCIYEVRYELQWHSSEPTHWEQQSVRVCAGCDALEAVERAKEAALSQNRLDDGGRREHCTDFRLREVLVIAQAELWSDSSTCRKREQTHHAGAL